MLTSRGPQKWRQNWFNNDEGNKVEQQAAPMLDVYKIKVDDKMDDD